jgi:hypothetical protein
MTFEVTDHLISGINSSTSQYETTVCAPDCELCKCGAGHVTVRKLVPISPSPKFSPEPNFGTHVREALDIVTDWWNHSRIKELQP